MSGLSAGPDGVVYGCGLRVLGWVAAACDMRKGRREVPLIDCDLRS